MIFSENRCPLFGIMLYVWAARADAEGVYTAEWKKFVEAKYGSAPHIEYLHSPVMVDNRAGTISVAA
jgi:hypothetical protein